MKTAKTSTRPTAQLAQEECKALVAKCLADKFSINDTSPNIEMHFEQGRKADASCSIAFQLAAKLKMSPIKISEEIAKQIKKGKLVEKATSLNGFVNFTFTHEYYASALREGCEKNYGCKAEKNTGSETVVIDYSCPNVGKPLHIGHIRSTIYGHSVKNLLMSQGKKTIGFNYLGDSGAQVAKLLLALEEYKDLPEIKTERDLLQYYVKINVEVEKNPALKERERKILEAIESGDAQVQSGLDKVRQLSLTAFKESYKILGVQFDEIQGESNYIEPAKKIVQECIEKKIAFKDKGGELVCELEPQLPNAVLVRSNGTTLYLTRDLALADYKFHKYKFNESIYITANEQNLHFRQVFATLEKLGRSYNNRHVGFGLIKIEGTKLSTREGKVLLLADVIREAQEEAKTQIISRNNDSNIKPIELNKRALAIGLAALKFAVLKVSAEKDINFNFKAMVSFEGDTGTYLQYSLVRCKSILEKAGEESKDEKIESEKMKKIKTVKKYDFNTEEKELLLHISAFPNVTANAAKSLSPHVLCDYLLKTAAAFSKFYSMHSVLDAESEAAKQQRLEMVNATANVMQKGLELLGITALEKM
ncbi:MAG: arginine--tRNA ligase [Candidatus Micrarchaeota archaeon]|nr:arginine--tRNA ligase [Candidatus Micrarchaeota archaeon]